MNYFFLFLSLFFISFSSLSNSLHAKNCVKTYALETYAGPEIYHVNRTKSGGAEQSGMLYGARVGYDRIRRFSLYWGIDALWAQGTLKGKAQENKLKSLFTDINVEARFGFTFQSKCWRCASFTPYIGGGYFWEKNAYQHPSPLTVHFKNHFSYVPVGFLSQIFITPNWSAGVNFKVRYLLEAENKVGHDPKWGKLTQHYQHQLQYRIELPISYFFCWKMHSLGASLVPFYEFRPYGYRANFPFDFLETKLKFCGATLKLLYLF